MSFEVTLMPSGHSFKVARGATLLSAGLAAGYALPYSCRQGSCGTCKGVLKKGSAVNYGDAATEFLSEEDQAPDTVLLCQAKAESDLVIEVTELPGLEGLKPRIVPCRVVAIERPSPEAAILKVRLPMNENMRFMAGQYVDFFVGDDARRSFSIASAPHAGGVTHLEFHLKKLPGGRFTDRVFNTMKLREILRFEGPLGTFFIRETAKPIILCATGTGFAPIKSMLDAAVARGLLEQRPIDFYWGSRTPDGLYALDLVRDWASRFSTLRFHPVLSGPPDARVPEARSGYLQDAVIADFPDLAGHEIYACGSPAMVHALRSATKARGLPAASFFSDEFLPASAQAAHIPATAS